MTSDHKALAVIKEDFLSKESELRKILSKTMEAERYVRIVLYAIERTPGLQSCSRGSLVRCLLQAASYGLEPTGLFGGAWMIPFQDKAANVSHAQLILSYVGLMRLVRMSGEVAMIDAQLVRGEDNFELVYGSSPKFLHQPKFDGGDCRLAYAYATLKEEGGLKVEVMTKDEIEGIRKRSRAGKSGPWVTDWGEMARKTVLRRLCKYLPLGVEAREAIAGEDALESGDIAALGGDEAAVIVEAKPSEAKTRASSVRAKVRAKKAGTPAEAKKIADAALAKAKGAIAAAEAKAVVVDEDGVVQDETAEEAEARRAASRPSPEPKRDADIATEDPAPSDERLSMMLELASKRGLKKRTQPQTGTELEIPVEVLKVMGNAEATETLWIPITDLNARDCKAIVDALM
jgi:phage RecT family recombinase